jgi:hypothetical protein
VFDAMGYNTMIIATPGHAQMFVEIGADEQDGCQYEFSLNGNTVAAKETSCRHLTRVDGTQFEVDLYSVGGKKLAKTEYDRDIDAYYSGMKKLENGSRSSGRYSLYDNNRKSVNESALNDFINGYKEPEGLVLSDVPADLIAHAESSDSQKDIYNQITIDDKNKLTAFLYTFSQTRPHSIDVNKLSDFQIVEFLMFGIHQGTLNTEEILSKDPSKKPIVDGGLQDGPYYYEYKYYPYSADKIDQLTSKLFGITLPRRNYTNEILPSAYDIAKFKDGDFYILTPIGDGALGVSPQVESLYSLGNELYYAKFRLYSQCTNCEKSIETWNDTEKKESIAGLTGYSIIREVVVNGEKSWRLVKYSREGDALSNEEILAYQNIATPQDIPADWAKAEVDMAKSLNVIPKDMQKGYDQNITRADFCKLVINLLTVKSGKNIDNILTSNGKTLNKTVFNDTSDDNILAANALRIVDGKDDGKFDPNGHITREEAAVILARTAKLLNMKSSTDTEFADSKDVSGWAKEAISFVSSLEDKTYHVTIMGSTGNNNFSPKENYTRQQAFITVKRLFNAN